MNESSSSTDCCLRSEHCARFVTFPTPTSALHLSTLLPSSCIRSVQYTHSHDHLAPRSPSTPPFPSPSSSASLVERPSSSGSPRLPPVPVSGTSVDDIEFRVVLRGHAAALVGWRGWYVSYPRSRHASLPCEPHHQITHRFRTYRSPADQQQGRRTRPLIHESVLKRL